jgi:hypothetical protein
MKKIKYISSYLLLAFIAFGCAKKEGIDQDLNFLNTASAKSLAKIFDISTDNSGNVKITPTGEGVVSYTVNYGHGTGAGASAVVSPGGSTTHAYPEGSYTVTIVAKDIAGHETSTTYPLQVTYRAPENIVSNISRSANSFSVKPTALYAASFLVYFGDVANEVGTAVAKGATVYHAYTTAGVYNVKVVALSGGAAKAEVTTPSTIPAFSFAFPLTFEDAAVNYFFGTFGGGQQFAKVANPNATGLNTSATVGKFTRGYEGWSGTYSPMDYMIDLSVGKKVKVWVYNPDPALIGAKLNVELEAAFGGSPSNGVGVLKVPITTSGAWEELVFDFSTVGALPANAKFAQLVLRFNDATDGAGAVIYVDNFRLTN